MKITIEVEVSIQELEAIFGKYKDIDISNPQEPVRVFNKHKVKDLNGVIITERKYRFSENTDAQRNTDTIIFDERMRGLICYARTFKIYSLYNKVVVSVPAQKGWETPVEELEVEPNWLEQEN